MQAVDSFRDRILDAAARGARLRIRGGGSKDWYGNAARGEVLDTRAWRGIVSYEPAELVITARAGTPLAEIEAALAERGQMLAFEPPHFGPDATLGGAIAAGLSGPRRASVGAVRDFVLGAVLMDGRGQVLHFGGQVMKNVAGYDVARLLTGSLGTLGLLLEVSVKVLPKPVCEATLRIACDQVEALRLLNTWGGQPLPLSASCWTGGALWVRLAGARAAVEEAQRLLGGEPVADAEGFWRSLREQEHGWFQGPGDLWRLSLPAHGLPLALGDTLIEWGGAQRWVRIDPDFDAAGLRHAIARAGGHATLWRAPHKAVGAFHPLAPAVARIHARLWDEFDPQHVFDRERLYAD
ncbi:glycolate oxidase subunit GlcE [Massilia sp. TS11]|uniref:glycolate oxidase subunit GlcE n=1 Tax=Massilia sp. TS11 TaxID=2908003 RepID=UPI001ED9E02B|nr:glycolate oxidase subunit GlcE [Massilia sp. TS11]MCG2585383.1 glycolate oxidase subunit GlcE [Massilia sp. TS11]